MFLVAPCVSLDSAKASVCDNIDLMVCGLHLDDPRMLDFFRFMTADPGIKAVTFLCIKAVMAQFTVAFEKTNDGALARHQESTHRLMHEMGARGYPTFVAQVGERLELLSRDRFCGNAEGFAEPVLRMLARNGLTRASSRTTFKRPPLDSDTAMVTVAAYKGLRICWADKPISGFQTSYIRQRGANSATSEGVFETFARSRMWPHLLQTILTGRYRPHPFGNRIK